MGTLGIDPDWVKTTFNQLSGVQHRDQGGFKEVYSATHPIHGLVALKIITPNQPIEVTEREIRAAKTVGSSRVPTILEVGLTDVPHIGQCVYLMESWISGTTIRKILEGGPLPFDSVLQLGKDVLEALASAEAARIVHRDVKPENIRCDESARYWLLDFGIARHLTLSSLTGSGPGLGKGTLGYASPEQMSNSKSEIDSRADLFAVGITLHECTTGLHPFANGAKSDIDVIQRVQRMRIPDLPNAATEPEFTQFILAMTQKQPHHRPSTVAEAQKWLEDLCASRRQR